MAFSLFKSRKNADKAQSAKDANAAVASSQVSANTASNGPGRGGNITEKGAVQASTPASSVNNSMNSLQGGAGAIPGPEQAANGRRGGPTTELPASDLPFRNGSAPAVQPMNAPPNASLYPWSQRRLTYTTAHPSPFPRYGAAVNSVASKEGDIYLMGGLINSSTVKGDLWMVEAGGNMACYPLATTAEGPGPRVGHASLLVGNAFIVYGGDTKMDDSDTLDETLYLLNTSTRQWSRAVPAGPRPSGRYGHSLNILGSKIYVFGGQVEGYFMNDLVAFDLNQLQVPTNRWEMLIRNSEEGGPPPGQIPPARTNHSIVTYNEKLYLFGGTNGFQWFNDVWCYDPVPNTWEALDCIGYIPAPREGHAAAIVDDVMYIFGGRTEEGADLGDLAAFRISSRRWYTFQNMGPSPSPRSGHSMTAYNKQVVVLAGEPSTATREAGDLGIVYLLDTSKIRYPNDQAVPPAPTADRVLGQRRPSGNEKSGLGANRGITAREGSTIPEPKRLNGAQTARDPGSDRGNGAPGVNGNDMNGIAPGSAQPQGAPMGQPPPGPPPIAAQQGSPLGGSKLPRASMAQAPPGPPPQQQAPTPRANGVHGSNGPNGAPGRGKPQVKADRGFGPAIDTSVHNRIVENVVQMSPSQQNNRNISPVSRESSQTRESPVMNGGRKTPTQAQTSKSTSSENGPPVSLNTVVASGSRSSSKSRQGHQQGSMDSTSEQSSLRNVTNAREKSPPPPTRQPSNPLARKGSKRNSQTVSILKELDAAKNRNAWYASELELARKAGYTPNQSASPMLDLRAAESFDDDDKPLIEALIAMKAELTNVQGSIDKQAVIAARKIAEVEKQRDAAVSEAVYAKARLAAHSGSQNSTPLPYADARELSAMSNDRSAEISKKLATALADQRDLNNKIEMLTTELEAEKRGRKLADDTLNAAQSRLSELEAYKQKNSSEVEHLKAELHEFQIRAREEAIVCSEAVAAAQILRADKDELEAKYQEAIGSTKDNSESFGSLRAALSSSADMRNVLERRLDEERTQREKIEAKLSSLKVEHEAQTIELESASRRLRDAEELAEQHANEARTHREAVMSGLDRVVARDVDGKSATGDDRTATLQAQIQAANALVRKYQQAADTASEKLRGAEERIAGLEAYQEQASREGMSIRKQLQATMREVQSLQAGNSDMKYQLANQQLETNAVHVQHNTLKDILGERGMSPVSAVRTRGLSSPRSGANTPDISRLRELEHQLATSIQAHEETKQTFESQQEATENTYREKLSQLENDYQSAVHYVKGTEKMLKRMKDELSKYKTDNTKLKEQLAEAQEKSGLSEDASAGWEQERASLHKQVESLQAEIQSSVGLLESQMAEVKKELASSHQERDLLKQNHEQSQHELSTATQQARSDLAQIQEENTLLERRAQDAEQKVTLLLDQVETSVDNYRRQSRIPDTNGGAPAVAASLHHQRSLSADSTSDTSLYDDGNRNSMALDSLASELETLRSHWENTNKNYRLSTAFDFEDRDAPALGVPGAGAGASTVGGSGNESLAVTNGGTGLSDSLGEWRKRLEDEEAASKSRKDSFGSDALSPTSDSGAGSGLGVPNAAKREMSPNGKDVGIGGSNTGLVNLI
ncbi:related to cell polarity protein tea1p [Rhynchosporium agropyri]|uniref:Related to cell polarity protein tea1p n=1 Tax=Rhynchosporium agropyri TaxID=914238 RepID=A0A1E1K153_9HELO|nr:related to cell polarity protein tea1p [Rhynchosporium agropyri]